MIAVINTNEHVFIAGMTQSGKTFLMKQYLANVKIPVFLLATKNNPNKPFEWKEVKEENKIYISTLAELKKAVKNSNSLTNKKFIFTPIWEELNEEIYNQFFEFCYKLSDCIVVIDEVMQVCNSASKIPEWYKGILTRGMELGVSCWSLTQRPKTIPMNILSESTHYFIFRLNNKDDRKRVVDNTGYNEFFITPQGHKFWYFNTITGNKPVQAEITVERRKAK